MIALIRTLVRYWRAATSSDQRRSRIFSRLGEHAFALRDWATARQHFAEAVTLNPARWRIWVQLGHAAKEAGDIVEAETAYRYALALEPQSSDTHLHFAHLLKRQHQWRDAQIHFLNVVSLNRGHAEAWSELLFVGRALADEPPIGKVSNSIDKLLVTLDNRVDALLREIAASTHPAATYLDGLDALSSTDISRTGVVPSMPTGAASVFGASEFNLDRAKKLLHITQDIVRSAAREPTLEAVGSQLCTASQFRSPIYRKWCARIQQPPRLHRKQWEFVYVLHALEMAGKLSPGMRGLGFGCGKEPLPAAMTAHGCTIVATDLELPAAVKRGWVRSHEHTGTLEDLFRPGVCDRDQFFKNASFRNVDMTDIPTDLVDFDFVWSSCALEHLGSIERGTEFVLKSTTCLRPGGVAVHTTEFNLSSNTETFEHEALVLFRKRDIESLIARLGSSGCTVAPLNLTIGERPEDGFVDLPPFKSEPHLKLALHGYLATSLGLIITKA